jgi:hypothetical protein
MTFLKDLTAAAPHCYTHYSTVLRSIYSRITGDVLLSRMHVDEGYSSAFEHKLSAFLKQAFCRKLRDIHGSMNIHCHYLAQQFLKEENYPLPEEPIMDEQVHLAATLLLFRQEKLGIAFEEEDENIVQSDQLLYEDTKRLYFAILDQDLLNQAFIFEQTLNLLIEGLSSENSENFLAHLTTWLESKKISTHAVLRLNDSGDYIIRRSGVLEILSRMPRKMVL